MPWRPRSRPTWSRKRRVLKGARTVIKAVREVLGRVNSSIPEPEQGFDWFTTGNYSATTRRFLTTAAHMPEEKAYSPHHATHGHCYSADQLITLAALEADGRPSHGRRVLVLASSARRGPSPPWSAWTRPRRDATARLARSTSPRQGTRRRAGSTL
ncbi:hypothetical protein ACIOGW_36970 [Streptomyces anulatus]